MGSGIFGKSVEVGCAGRRWLMSDVRMLVLMRGFYWRVERCCGGASQADPPCAVFVADVFHVAAAEAESALQATQHPNQASRANAASASLGGSFLSIRFHRVVQRRGSSEALPRRCAVWVCSLFSLQTIRALYQFRGLDAHLRGLGVR